MVSDTVDMDKLCFGCVLHEELLVGLDNYHPCAGYLIKDIECPCINCLVKMVCRFTCKELTGRSWWHEYNKSRGKEN